MSDLATVYRLIREIQEYSKNEKTEEASAAAKRLVNLFITVRDEIYSRAESAEAKVKEMEAAQEWIPIATGRLPERGQECEVIDPAGYIHNWVHTDQLLNIFAKYTHWRPLTLPQPPKPEEK